MGPQLKVQLHKPFCSSSALKTFLKVIIAYMLRLPERTADTDPLIKFLKKEKKKNQQKNRIQNLTIKFGLGWMSGN